MPNDNNLCGLYLHFDEVREVMCERCDGTGLEGFMVYDGTEDGHAEEGDCSCCHGTGRKRVRVWGKVEVELACITGSEAYYRPVNIGIVERSHRLPSAVITAFLAGTLPGDVAQHITKEDL